MELLQQQPHAPKTVLARLVAAIGKTISIDTLRRVAKAAGFTWKRLRKRKQHDPDPVEYQQAVAEIAELQQQEARGEIDLRYWDESGFSLEPVVSYAWQHKDEPLQIPTGRSTRLNVLGLLNTHNDFDCFCVEGSVTGAVVCACLDAFSRKLTKKTVVLIDNAPIHTTVELLAQIPVWETRGLVLKFLPPYSPELNLIEILWRFIKHHWLPLSAYSSFPNLVQAVEAVLAGIGTEWTIDFAASQ